MVGKIMTTKFQSTPINPTQIIKFFKQFNYLKF
jgi:hypothetical protein